MDSNWQTTRPSIKERTQYVYNNKLFSDVEFKLADTEGNVTTVSAHKLILAVSSPVFEAMFHSELAETGRTISLPDCTAEGLLELFRYLYYDEVELTGSNVMEILYLAKKYIVPSLVDRCIQYLEKELQPEDVFIILPEAEKLGDKTLQDICWETVDSETLRAVTSEPFMHVTQDTLCDILERDTLQIMEVQLFQAVNRWAEYKIRTHQPSEEGGQSKREVMGDKVIHLLRFPVMTMEEFVEVVLPTEVLNMSEVTELLTMFTYFNSICGQGKETLVKTFNAMDRVSLPPVEDSCKRFKSYTSDLAIGWIYKNDVKDSITFSTTKDIYLTGVKLFGGYDSQHTVKLSVYKKGQLLARKDVGRRESTCFDGGYHYGFTIKMDKPVFIHQCIDYCIEASISGPMSHYGEHGKAVVKCKNATFHFIDRENESHTSVARGQFYELLFYQHFKSKQ